MANKYKCDLQRARELGIHPLKLYFGLDSLESRYMDKWPKQPIYFYEECARIHKLRNRGELDDKKEIYDIMVFDSYYSNNASWE